MPQASFPYEPQRGESFVRSGYVFWCEGLRKGAKHARALDAGEDPVRAGLWGKKASEQPSAKL